MSITNPSDGAVPRAFAYVRMSTAEQDLGDSRRRQLEYASRYAADHELQIVTNFEGEPFEDVGLSAYTGEHISSGRFGRFLAALKDGRTIRNGDYLLAESFDRISRQDAMTAFNVLHQIISAGVILVTTADAKEYRTGLDIGAIIQSIISMARSNEESEFKRARLAETWVGKRANAERRKLTSRCPAWLEVASYDYSGKRPLPKAFRPIPERVKIVRRIFQECVDGIGYRTIADRLTRDGISPFGKSRSVAKNPRLKPYWQPSSVEKILQNRAVLGEFQPYRYVGKKPNRKREPVGDPIQNYYGDAIIPQILFDRAQTGRRQRKTWNEASGSDIGRGGNRGKFVSNLFTGLLYCAACGSRMAYRNKGKLPKGGTYLVCSDVRNCQSVKPTSWRYKNFESSFLTWVRKVDWEAIFAEQDDALRRRQLEEEIEGQQGAYFDLESRKKNIITAIEKAQSPDVIDTLNETLGECLKQIRNVQESIEKTRDELAKARLEADAFYRGRTEIAALVENIPEKQNDQTFRMRAKIAARLQALLSRVDVAPSGVVTNTDIRLMDGVEKGETALGLFADVTPMELDSIARLARKPSFTVHFKDGSSVHYKVEEGPERAVWTTDPAAGTSDSVRLLSPAEIDRSPSRALSHAGRSHGGGPNLAGDNASQKNHDGN